MNQPQPKIKFGRKSLLIATITFVTALCWIGLSVYQAASETRVSQVTQRQLRTLNPNLDTETLEQVRQGITFTNQEFSGLDQPAVTEPTTGKTEAETTAEPTPGEGAGFETTQGATESAMLDENQ